MDTTQSKPPSYNDEIAALFRARRGELGISNPDIAAAAEMSESSVVRLLLAQRSMSVPQLIALARALDLNLGEVIESARQRIEKRSL